MPKPEETELAAILDAPENASSDAARLEALSAAFSSKASALRRCEKKLADAHANAGVVKIQRDAAKADLAKATAVKDKLEALCRELQLANKTVVADAKAAALSEAERREQLSKQFESGLEGISSKLETHAKERESFAKENDELRAHLKSLLERSDLQEAHFQKAKQTFDLEKQLLEARCAEANERAKATEARAAAAAAERDDALGKEKALLDQLAGYADRFQEFQTVVSGSNEHFATFKAELEAQAKRLEASERRRAELERKTRESDVAVIELLEERAALAKANETLRAQREKLEGLCRAALAKGGKENEAS